MTLVLHALQPVQKFSGDLPFSALQRMLAAKHYLAVGLDAPFSVPAFYIPQSGHAELLGRVSQVAREHRPFCRARDFIQCVASTHKLKDQLLSEPKPYRETEKLWRRRGLNVRSTLWAGARGGAAMTAAALTLVAPLQCRLWPWQTGGTNLIVEAFPMAQLHAWDLPYTGYNDSSKEAAQQRATIVDALRERIELGCHDGVVQSNADALDAVLCAFAAIAVTEECLKDPVDPAVAALEGWIAVHS